MKVRAIEIENFKGITAQRLQANGAHIFLTASNGQGKTSFLDAVWAGIGGKKMPSEPVKKGEKKAHIKIDLGEYVAETVIDARTNKKKFTLKTADGTPVKAQAKSILNKAVGMIDFNPMDFFNLTEKKRVEYICNIVGGEVKDKIDTIDVEYQEVFESRAYDKKASAELQAKIEPYDKTLLSQQPQSAAELTKQLHAVTEHNLEYNRISKGVQEFTAAAERMRSEIAELEKKLNEAVTKITAGEVWLLAPENRPKDAAPLEDQLNNIDTSNEKVRAAHATAALEQEVERKDKEVEQADNKLAELLESKREVISSAVNVEGLTYDGEQFLYNGLPFQADQINQSDIIIAGLSIGAKMLNEVRILRFEGSLLDDEKIKQVTAWADQNNVQLFVEFVSREQSGLVVEMQEAAN